MIDAAEKLAANDIGALPVCNADRHLQSVMTDRDIVVQVLAAGKDPSTTTRGELMDQPEPVTIGADDTVEEAIATMKRFKVRQLPVIDGTDLVGFINQADLARRCPPEMVGELVAAISS